MFTWKQLMLLAPILLCGCAHGFDRVALRERLNDGTLQMSDGAIAEARATRPQLRLPCRIAVYLKPADRGEWRWTPEDRAAMEQWAATLKKEGIATDVFPIPEMLAGKGDVKELRLAAAKCGADALFIVHGVSQTDSYKNVASVFNLTVVGGYVVPGSHKDSLFMMEGCLMDVDNGYIYTGVQSEGVGKIMRPTFVIEEKDSVTMAKTKAVSQFGDEVLRRMRTLSSTNTLANAPARSVSASDAIVKGVTSILTPAGYSAPVVELSSAPKEPLKPTGITTGVTTGLPRAKSSSAPR